MDGVIWQSEEDVKRWNSHIIEQTTNVIDNYPEYEFIGSVYVKRGLAYMSLGEFDLAIDDFESAKATDYRETVHQLQELINRCQSLS